MEDSPNDIELTLSALTENHLANEVVVVRSYNLGVNAYVVKPVDFQEFVAALREIGLFWAVINRPPPGSVGSADGIGSVSPSAPSNIVSNR